MTKQFEQIRKNLEGRWKKEWSSQLSLSEICRMQRLSFNAVTELGNSAGEMRKAGKLSQKGLIEEVRALAANKTVPVLKKTSDALNFVETDLHAKRAQLTIPTPDPNNAAQAIVRSEMRTWLRSLPGTQAVQLLISEDVDERMLQAAFEAPPVMAGLTSQQRHQIFEGVTRRKFGPELDKVALLEEAVEQGRAVLDVCVNELRQEAMFDLSAPSEFNGWMKVATARAISEEQGKPFEEVVAGYDDCLDEIFARAFPKFYPNHPANRPLA